MARGEGQSLLIGICYNVTSWFLPVRLQCGIHQHMERDVQNGSQHKYRLFRGRYGGSPEESFLRSTSDLEANASHQRRAPSAAS